VLEGAVAETLPPLALFDASGRYRYRLRRQWRQPPGRPVLFVLLNPSTADAVRDDATIRRCLGFARAWGYGALEAVNLFALRTTDPALLRRAGDPVGPENDAHIAAAVAAADLVVAGWGAHGAYRARDQEVIALILRQQALWHLGLTRDGRPRHPLYLPRDMRPQPWRIPGDT
jgi:hypothetical protein